MLPDTWPLSKLEWQISMKIKDLQDAQQKNLLWKIVWDNLPLKEAKDEL